MTRASLRLLTVVSLAGAFIISGCSSEHTVVVRERAAVAVPAGEVVVSHKPPPLRHEVVGVAPTPEHVWVAGYWTYYDARWVWVPGHWELRPRAGAAYIPGHWDKTPRGWVWTPGHWE